MVIKKIREMYQKRVREKNRQKRLDGYDWAAGNLLRKDMTVNEVRTEVDNPFIIGDLFEYGALDAVRDFNEITK